MIVVFLIRFPDWIPRFSRGDAISSAGKKHDLCVHRLCPPWEKRHHERNISWESIYHSPGISRECRDGGMLRMIRITCWKLYSSRRVWDITYTRKTSRQHAQTRENGKVSSLLCTQEQSWRHNLSFTVVMQFRAYSWNSNIATLCSF